MTHAPPAANPLGDSAFTVTLGDEASSDLLKRIHAAAASVRRAELEHVCDVVPGHTTVTVFYDPLRTSFAEISPKVIRLVTGPQSRTPESPRQHVIPVRYDGADLNHVAAETGLTLAEVIQLHSRRTYTVELLGFAPGFAYLGEVDDRLSLPRRPQPRLRVPAGSVAIAGSQTAVYPLSTPGGWHLIGHTASVMFDPRRNPPALLGPGDQVRFEEVP